MNSSLVFILIPPWLSPFIVIFLVFLFDIKRLNILCILEAAQGVCMYVWTGHLCSSTWGVTHHCMVCKKNYVAGTHCSTCMEYCETHSYPYYKSTTIGKPNKCKHCWANLVGTLILSRLDDLPTTDGHYKDRTVAAYSRLNKFREQSVVFYNCNCVGHVISVPGLGKSFQIWIVRVFVVIFLYFIWCKNTQYYFVYVEIRVYACVHRWGTCVRPRGTWLSTGIDVRLRRASKVYMMVSVSIPGRCMCIDSVCF